MRPRAVLLRLLLCLVLVANVTAAAFANTRMAMDGMAPAAMQHDDAACHDMDTDGVAAMDHDAPPPTDSHKDCCGSACLCDCVAHATPVVTVDALAWSPPPDVAPIAEQHTSRASPALPHPIRPPIG